MCSAGAVSPSKRRPSLMLEVFGSCAALLDLSYRSCPRSDEAVRTCRIGLKTASGCCR
jgi:hypothetical protein